MDFNNQDRGKIHPDVSFQSREIQPIDDLYQNQNRNEQQSIRTNSKSGINSPINGIAMTYSKQYDNEKQIELQLVNYQLQSENTSLLNQLQELSRDNRALNFKLKQIESSLEQLYQDKLAQNSATMEIAALKQNNERLITLLSQSKEYKHSFNKDDELRFLKRVQSSDCTSIKKVRIIPRPCKENYPEELLWIPTQAFKIASNYNLSEEDKIELLYSVNVSFHQFWDAKNNRLKQSQEKELSQFKRQYLSRQPYDELFAQKKITRLQGQLMQQKQKIDIPINRNAQNAQIQQCFLKISQQEDELKALRYSQIDKNQTQDQNELKQVHRREIFYNGALWMIDRIESEVDQHNKYNFQQVSIELNNKFGQLIQSHDLLWQQIITMVYKWLLDVVDEYQGQLYDKITAIRQSSIFEIENDLNNSNSLFK